MKPIPQWRSAWRMWSVQFASLLVFWALLPAEQQGAILGLLGVPADAINGVLAVLVLVSRLIAQPALTEAKDAERPQ